MKKGKLLSSIVSLCFALAVLTFGVFAAQQVNYTLSGQISYEVSDAYVEVQTAIYKSATRLDYEGLYHACKNAEDVASVGGNVSGLTLVQTSSKWSSVSENQTTYDFDNANSLAFTSESGQQAYAFIFVINVKNLSSDVNSVYSPFQPSSTLEVCPCLFLATIHSAMDLSSVFSS